MVSLKCTVAAIVGSGRWCKDGEDRQYGYDYEEKRAHLFYLFHLESIILPQREVYFQKPHALFRIILTAYRRAPSA